MYLCCSRQIRRRCLCDRQMRKRSDETRQAANQSLSVQKWKSLSRHKVLQTRRGQEIQGNCYVYIFMEYVIGCLVDLLYTGLNIVPYFQKMYLCNCSFQLLQVMVTVLSAYNKKNFGLVMAAHVMIKIKLSKTFRCMQVVLYICVHVYKIFSGFDLR